MSKEDNLNFLKIQTCVLKVNIDCEGCKKKVKKLLQKIDGVYTISIDAEQGKVTVSGSADPSTLIKKLSKAGKPAELLVPKGGSNNNFLNDQPQKLKLDGGKGQQKDNGKPQKGGGGGGGGAGGGGKDQKGEQPGLKDLKLPLLKELNFPSQKDQKNVKYTLPEDFDDGSDFDDDDEFDDDDDDDFDDDMDSIEDEFDMNPMLENKGASGVGENNGGKKGRGDHGPKDSSKNGEKKNNGNNGNPVSGGSKKGADRNEGHRHPMSQNPKTMMGQGFNGPDMGKTDGPTLVPGMVAAAANPHHHQQQQAQYMEMMRRQQQQQQMMMMNGPTVYGQPTGYVPAAVPAYGEPCTNIFSDENTNSSCSIM